MLYHIIILRKKRKNKEQMMLNLELIDERRHTSQ